VLNPREVYKGKVIYYSLGNFCFGGGGTTDRDSVIVQILLERGEDGGIIVTDKAIPCSVTSTRGTNDLRPRILSESDEQYDSVIKKLGI
jgi:poly-gamma-glutamate synthesis protein (capsule biosynthesis protein)